MLKIKLASDPEFYTLLDFNKTILYKKQVLPVLNDSKP